MFMRMKSHSDPRRDEYVDEKVSDKATMMNNDNDDNERRWMEWSVMRWDSAVVTFIHLTE